MLKKVLTLKYCHSMKKIVSVFIRFPFYANIVLFIILGIGALSFVSMNRSFFPELSEKFINDDEANRMLYREMRSPWYI